MIALEPNNELNVPVELGYVLCITGRYFTSFGAHLCMICLFARVLDLSSDLNRVACYLI